MCAEQRPGRCSQGRLPVLRAADTLTFAGQPATDEVLSELGQDRAAWIEPKKGKVIEVADFERPADDPRPAIGPLYEADEGCGLVPVEFGR